MSCSCLPCEETRSALLANALALVQEVTLSGVEFDDDRLGYVTVQVDRDLWESLALLVGQARRSGVMK